MRMSELRRTMPVALAYVFAAVIFATAQTTTRPSTHEPPTPGITAPRPANPPPDSPATDSVRNRQTRVIRLEPCRRNKPRHRATADRSTPRWFCSSTSKAFWTRPRLARADRSASTPALSISFALRSRKSDSRLEVAAFVAGVERGEKGSWRGRRPHQPRRSLLGVERRYRRARVIHSGAPSIATLIDIHIVAASTTAAERVAPSSRRPTGCDRTGTARGCHIPR